jgi:hypothetical protein
VCIAAASAGCLGASIAWGRRRLPSSLLVAASSAVLLVGCVTDYGKPNASTASSTSHVPLPKRALLAPPTQPACMLQTPGLTEQSQAERAEPGPTLAWALAAQEGSNEPNGSGDWPPTSEAMRRHMLVQTEPNSSLSQRIRLEYERDCFQRAEIRLRKQLLQLQAAIDKTIRSVKRISRDPTQAP